MKVSDRLCPATSAKPRGLTSGFAPSSSFHSARFSLGNGLDGVGNRAELWPDPETSDRLANCDRSRARSLSDGDRVAAPT
jgi:hypothetical protein